MIFPEENLKEFPKSGVNRTLSWSTIVSQQDPDHLSIDVSAWTHLEIKGVCKTPRVKLLQKLETNGKADTVL